MEAPPPPPFSPRSSVTLRPMPHRAPPRNVSSSRAARSGRQACDSSGSATGGGRHAPAVSGAAAGVPAKSPAAGPAATSSPTGRVRESVGGAEGRDSRSRRSCCRDGRARACPQHAHSRRTGRRLDRHGSLARSGQRPAGTVPPTPAAARPTNSRRFPHSTSLIRALTLGNFTSTASSGKRVEAPVCQGRWNKWGQAVTATRRGGTCRSGRHSCSRSPARPQAPHHRARSGRTGGVRARSRHQRRGSMTRYLSTNCVRHPMDR
jgi:hypothetical protein